MKTNAGGFEKTMQEAFGAPSLAISNRSVCLLLIYTATRPVLALRTAYDKVASTTGLLPHH